jgi:hypothetical protein
MKPDTRAALPSMVSMIQGGLFEEDAKLIFGECPPTTAGGA